MNVALAGEGGGAWDRGAPQKKIPNFLLCFRALSVTRLKRDVFPFKTITPAFFQFLAMSSSLLPQYSVPVGVIGGVIEARVFSRPGPGARRARIEFRKCHRRRKF